MKVLEKLVDNMIEDCKNKKECKSCIHHSICDSFSFHPYRINKRRILDELNSNLTDNSWINS